MESILIQQANSAPSATAVVHDTHTISYRELIMRADILVDLLEKHSLEPETPVFTLVQTGLPQVLAQIAVLRAGGTCVPVDPTAPPNRIKGMLEDLDTTLIIANSDSDLLAPDMNVVPIEAALDAQVDINNDQEISVRAGRPETHRSHILFTSGSTGRPKPVQVLTSSILHVLRSIRTGPLGSSDRSTAMLNPGFDFSILEMWKALLEGATVVHVPHIIRNDTLALQNFLKEQQITFTCVPTALFEVIALTAPEAFHGVRHVIVGGEAVSSSAMRTVLEASPPENLWNIYGPAEATICVTMARVDHQEAQRSRITIGHTFGDTKIFLLDGDLKPINEPKVTGELYIAGPQVRPGYLNREEENEKSFVSVDVAGTLIHMYRSGDLAQWRDKAGGSLDHIGRADDQIKISGYRVELGEVSRVIEEHPRVHSSVVNYQKENGAEYLEAYVVLGDQELDLNTEELIDWTNKKLPPYMVPSKVVKKETFPLTLNGKVDREALVSGNSDDETATPHEWTPEESDGDTGDLPKWLASVLQPMLPSWSGNPSDNFFSLGLGSLQAAQFLGRIRREQGKTISLAQLHSHPTIKTLAQFLADPSPEDNPESGIERWKRDLKDLENTILLPEWRDADEGRVFLTGATGFLGAHILQQLLCMPEVKQVACLARGQSGVSASARIQRNLEKYKLWDSCSEKTEKIIVLEGDLADPTLGLGERQFNWLANWASVIFHVGARVNWCEPYEAHYGSNILGMSHIIRAATLGRRKPLHYVSSIDVWTATGFINNAERVDADEPLMPHINAAPYDTGYSISQVVAEELLQRARGRGLPTAIYRPGFIVGHSEHAIANANDYFSRLVMGCIQIGYFPDLPTQYLEYITVDYVTSAILHISSDLNNLGRAYHVVPPDRRESISYGQLHQMLQDLGYQVEKIDYFDWVDKVRESPGNPLEAMMPLLEEEVCEGMTRLQTSLNTPVFDPRNTRIALKDSQCMEYVALNSGLLQRFIQNWVDRGEFTLDYGRAERG
ncbi:uncharacterized protein N7515_002081 [Penicillium bovifimosum]|uniref:Carrier domain-containing protein n=1 Tax=Penicillium bovifimosum TaxID=126998 RepID=A0A9W9L9C2_9EURO|nr:uncharacterized protein N7515_002081 [Penicillium bovifimosum]KAJ5143294.1 hypothetical protein N7515_002081 [Penicillium bovifimosum]